MIPAPRASPGADSNEPESAADGRRVGRTGANEATQITFTGSGTDQVMTWITIEVRVPIGVGVHWGRAFVGGVGDAGHLVTISAFGDSVNVAARLSSVAKEGQAVVSEAACLRAGLECGEYAANELSLKGRTEPITAHVISL